ncbi:flagellar protein FlaG [Pseudomonas sp. KSR10]|uniref:flagellar protein FlaG n=1 Tax=Pseudomonas sp. KSR10 TaxID=2916654 RepID=UPI001EF88E96|nr:flagellar protein FlaG [Pseudomonas sp. KSR10]MCG6542515.1 flagellar protein FlaG [Pseudomonas sp. KSR10]
MDVAKATWIGPALNPLSTAPRLSKEPGFSSSDRQEVAAPSDDQAAQPTAVGEAVEKLLAQMQSAQRDLSFSIDDSTGDLVVRVVDGESGTVVRQIPSEEILRLAERLDEMRSLLFETKA